MENPWGNKMRNSKFPTWSSRHRSRCRSNFRDSWKFGGGTVGQDAINCLPRLQVWVGPSITYSPTLKAQKAAMACRYGTGKVGNINLEINQITTKWRLSHGLQPLPKYMGTDVSCIRRMSHPQRLSGPPRWPPPPNSILWRAKRVPKAQLVGINVCVPSFNNRKVQKHVHKRIGRDK